MKDEERHDLLTRVAKLSEEAVSGISKHSARSMVAAGAALGLTFSNVPYFKEGPWHPLPVTVLLVIFGAALGVAVLSENKLAMITWKFKKEALLPERSGPEILKKVLQEVDEPDWLRRISWWLLIAGVIIAIGLVPILEVLGASIPVGEINDVEITIQQPSESPAP